MEEKPFNYVGLLILLLIFGVVFSYFFISHMPPIKVQIVGQLLK